MAFAPYEITTDGCKAMPIAAKRAIWPLVRRELCWLTIPAAFAVAAYLAVNIDCAISGWCIELWKEKTRLSGLLLSIRDVFGVFENFGNGWGVAVIVLTIFVLDPARRWALPRLLCCAYGAGMAANGFKLLLSRTRPNDFDFLKDVSASFGAWLPGTGAGSIGQSFPSAHTATAIGLAAGLAWLYPRGRWLFLLFAVMVGGQRIQSGAHFTSDVLAGATIGSVVALGFLKCGWLPGLMGRLESWLRSDR